MDTGKALRTIRAAKAISQKQLAALVGLDPSYVSLIEAGKREPSLEALELIATKLGVPFYLLVLLGSEQRDLKGLKPELAQGLGLQLLEMLAVEKKGKPHAAARKKRPRISSTS